LAKEFHPDMHQDKDADAIKVLTDKFIQIKNAYDFIVEMKSGYRQAA
jgi:DnaJ-class molecular chaperone